VKLERGLGGFPAGQKGVIRIVVFPLAVAASEDDVVREQPVANEGDVGGAGVVVDDVGEWKIELIGGEDLVFGVKEADLAAVIEAAADEIFAVTRKGFGFGIRDFAGEAETAGRIAPGAGVALDEDAMEDAVFGVIDPMLGSEVLAGDADVDAADGGVAQAAGGIADLRRSFIGDGADEKRKRHGADERSIRIDLAIIERHGVGGWGDAAHAGVETETAFQERQKSIHQALETAVKRVAETRVGSHRFGDGGESAFDHLFEIGKRDASAEPAGFHFGERDGPDFAVVGDGEVRGDSVAPDLIDELFEIGGFDRGLDIAGANGAYDAFLDHLGRQTKERALEGIAGVDVVAVDPGFAILPVDVVAEKDFVHLVDVGILAEHDVAGVIEGEAFVLEGAAPTADAALFFDEDGLRAEVIGGTEAGRASPEDNGRGVFWRFSYVRKTIFP